MSLLILVFALGLLIGFLAGVALVDVLIQFGKREERSVTSKSNAKIGRSMLTIGLVAAVVLQLIVGLLLIDARRDLAQAARDDAAAEIARVRYTTCTNEWQQQFASAYKARLQASTDVSAAVEAVIRAVDIEDIAKLRAAVDAYIKVRDTQTMDQRDNPYPPLPDELCGEEPSR